ncbi:ABC transporter substrate-binding protein [Vibrio kyushuensis]|uniref:ABC transporter substrate-binding protein n=1 Tax=Vibrio kyushuensis TaxID=2910249 RepID=UPI003D0C5417
MKSIYLLLLFFISAFAYSQEMVFVHSYHFEYPWVKEYRQGFESEIDGFNIHHFQMDTKRRPAEEFEEIADKAWTFIEQNKPDVVVISDDNALKYLGPRLTKNRIPTFFLGINANPRLYVSITDTITGVLERHLLENTVHMIKKLQPSVKRIKIIMDSGATSHAILETSFSNKTKLLIHGIEVNTYFIGSKESWFENTKSAKSEGYDALIMTSFASLKDKSGQHFLMDDVISWTSSHTPIPLYSFWNYEIGTGKAIAGVTVSALQQGITAAQQVKQYIDSGIMPMITTPKKGNIVFSQTELKRWNIQAPPELLKRAKLRD